MLSFRIWKRILFPFPFFLFLHLRLLWWALSFVFSTAQKTISIHFHTWCRFLLQLLHSLKIYPVITSTVVSWMHSNPSQRSVDIWWCSLSWFNCLRLLFQTIQPPFFCIPAWRSAPESDGLRHPHCIPPIRLFCALHLPLSAAGAVLPRHIPWSPAITYQSCPI